MRALMPAMVVLAAALFSLSPAAADVTFDVEVNVNDLAADVSRIVVLCYTCPGDCPDPTTITIDSLPRLELEKGQNAHEFTPGGAHSFNGTITVLARTVRQGTPTHYLCAMKLLVLRVAATPQTPSGFQSDPSLRPKRGTAFVPHVAGKLQ